MCAGICLLAAPEWVLAVNGVSFFVSAALLRRVPLSAMAEANPEPGTESGTEETTGTIREGLAYVRRLPGVGTVVVLGALGLLCGTMINVAEPVLATVSLPAGATGFAVLVGVYGAGTIAGSLVAGRLGRRLPVLRAGLLVGLAVNGLAMAPAGGAATLAVALPAFGLGGLAPVVSADSELRLLHELILASLLGRIMGLREAVQCAGFALAVVAAGGTVTAAGPRAIYLVGGVGLLVFTALGGLALRTRQGLAEPALVPVAAA